LQQENSANDIGFIRTFAAPCAGKCGLVKQLLKAGWDLTFLCLCVGC